MSGAETISDWIDHDGNGMPVHPETRVTVRFRDGMAERVDQANKALFWGGDEVGSNWNHTSPCSADIVAYRVHTPSPGSVGGIQ